MGPLARDPFSTLEVERPRIMVTPKVINTLRSLLSSNPKAGELKDRVVAQADEFLAADPITWKCGKQLDEARDALRRLQTLGIVWLLDGDRDYLERAKRELRAICDLPDWHPEHFLTTAELTHAAAIGLDWFYGELEGEHEEVVEAIRKKGLEPGLRDLRFNTKWPRRVNNWNIVCNGSLMIGAIALADHERELERELSREVFELALNSVPTGFHGYSPDGSWGEGPGYWSYATEYVGYLLSALSTALGHEFGLGHLPALSNTGLFRLHATGASRPCGESHKRVRMFNFSDCEETRRGSWCMRWLSTRYGRPEYNRYAMENDDKRAMDLLWFSSTVPPPGKELERNAVFRGRANIAVLRGRATEWSLKGRRLGRPKGFQPWSDQRKHPVYVALRAGENSYDNQHGHLDLGSFVLDLDEVRWATDIEPVAGDYDLPDYFEVAQDKRFRYYRTATIGHNTLVVDGQNQPLGVETEIIAWGRTDGLLIAVADLTAAYPDCRRVRRGVAVINDEQVMIVDELTPRKRISVAWQMHTRATAVPGRKAVLKQMDCDGGKKQLFVQTLEDDAPAFEVQPATVAAGEPKNEGVVKLVASYPDIEKPLRISVLFSEQRGKRNPRPSLLKAPIWRWVEAVGGKQVSKESGRKAGLFWAKE